MKLKQFVVALLMGISASGTVLAVPATKPIELSDLIRNLLADQKEDGLSYLALKGVATGIEKAAPPFKEMAQYSVIWRGNADIRVKGKTVLRETMTDTEAWHIYFAGPTAGPLVMYLDGTQVIPDVYGKLGPAYFAAAGLEMAPVACSGQSDMNFIWFLHGASEGQEDSCTGNHQFIGKCGPNLQLSPLLQRSVC